MKTRFNVGLVQMGMSKDPEANTEKAAAKVAEAAARGAEEILPYDALVLSPGARPVRPPIPGIERALSYQRLPHCLTLPCRHPDSPLSNRHLTTCIIILCVLTNNHG